MIQLNVFSSLSFITAFKLDILHMKITGYCELHLKGDSQRSITGNCCWHLVMTSSLAVVSATERSFIWKEFMTVCRDVLTFISYLSTSNSFLDIFNPWNYETKEQFCVPLFHQILEVPFLALSLMSLGQRSEHWVLLQMFCITVCQVWR